MDRRRLREAATCPLGDHRSTEHRALFRPMGIGLRSGTRSLALFVEPVSVSPTLARTLSRRSSLLRSPNISFFFSFFSFFLSLSLPCARVTATGPRECPRVYARGDTYSIRVFFARLKVKK